MAAIEIPGSSRSRTWRRLDRRRFKTRPTPTGRITNSKIAYIKARNSISMSRPASTRIARGVMNGAMRVEQAVIETESATFPFAKNAITFEATPPEQEPIRMTPAAISAGKPNDRAILQPSKGMAVN